MKKLEVSLEELYKIFSAALLGVEYSERDRIFHYLGDTLKLHHNISEEDIEVLNQQFAIKEKDTEDIPPEYKDRCCMCEEELYFTAAGSNCIAMCEHCKNEICNSKECYVETDDKIYCLHCHRIIIEEASEDKTLG